MDTQFAIDKAGGRRDDLARLLGIETITTYQPSWKPNIPPKHERYLRALKPEWFTEWEKAQRAADRKGAR
jgi:hypothetical protein